MDGYDGVRISEERPQPLAKITESIAMFRKYDDLPTLTCCREHERIILEGFSYFLPFCVSAGTPHLLCLFLKPSQRFDFSFEFGDCAGRRC